MEFFYRLPEEIKVKIVGQIGIDLKEEIEEKGWRILEYTHEFDNIVNNMHDRCNCFNCRLFYQRALVEEVKEVKSCFVARVQRRVANYEQLLRDLGTGTDTSDTGTTLQNVFGTGTEQSGTGTTLPKMPRLLYFCIFKLKIIHR